MIALPNNRYAIVTTLAVIIAILPFTFPSSYYLRVASLVWVFAFAAIGLNVLMGKAGQVSLGHAAFFGIGAYSGVHLVLVVRRVPAAGSMDSAKSR
jgi:branched-chain amino acid transport system permease protein